MAKNYIVLEAQASPQMKYAQCLWAATPDSLKAIQNASLDGLIR